MKPIRATFALLLFGLSIAVAHAHGPEGTISNRVGLVGPEVAKQRLKAMGVTNVGKLERSGQTLRAVGTLKGKQTHFEIDALRSKVRTLSGDEVKAFELKKPPSALVVPKAP